MTDQTDFFSSFPVDPRALWGTNGDYAEKAYRAWLQAAGEIQGNAIDYLKTRLARDSVAITRLGSCRTPAELFDVQQEYTRHAIADMMNEGQKLAAYFNRVARAGEAEHKPRKHAVRRGSGH